MNVVIAVLLAKPRKKFEDVNYLVGYHHLLESLRRHNSSLPPIVVLSPDLKRPPPGADRLVRINERDYRNVENVQAAFGKSVYFKLDVFRLDFDRVIYFDTDVLTFADISELWDPDRYTECGLYGIRESAELGLLNPDWQGRFNTGVMVINQSFLGEQTFASLIELANKGSSYDLGDQGVLNAYISQSEIASQIGCLDPCLNMPSCVRTHGDWEKYRGDIRAMHFLGPRKPWRTSPAHEWYHADTQRLWDQEIAEHPPVPKQMPALRSSLHTRIVRLVQRYENWRDAKK